MNAQVWLWGAAGCAILLAVAAGVADHRRQRRVDLDNVGWVPWRGVQVTAFGAALALAILAVKAG